MQQLDAIRAWTLLFGQFLTKSFLVTELNEKHLDSNQGYSFVNRATQHESGLKYRELSFSGNSIFGSELLVMCSLFLH